MRKNSGGFAVDALRLNSERFEQGGESHRTTAVNSVDGNFEILTFYQICINVREIQNSLDVILNGIGVFGNRTDFIKQFVIECLFIGDVQYLFPLIRIQKFTFAVQKLQSIPLFGIMAGC